MNIDEYIRCPITGKIFFEPVVASNGITFETIAIIEHFISDGLAEIKSIHMDKFDNYVLVSNLSIKLLVSNYLKQNSELLNEQYSSTKNYFKVINIMNYQNL